VTTSTTAPPRTSPSAVRTSSSPRSPPTSTPVSAGHPGRRSCGRSSVLLPARGRRRPRSRWSPTTLPFLVDSLTSALTTLGLGIASVAHPRLAARRDGAGSLLDLGAADGATPGHEVEAWIRFEVDGDLVPQDREASSSGSPPCSTTSAPPSTTGRSCRTGCSRRRTSCGTPCPHRTRRCRSPPGSCTGWPTTASPSSATAPTTSPPTSASCCARAAGWASSRPTGAARRARRRLSASLPSAPATQVLRVAKGQCGRPCTAPASSTSSACRRAARRGRSRASAASSGLFTSGAYTESVRRCRWSPRRWPRCCAGGFAPGGHSARDLLNILEFFPRDELMQAEVDDVLRTALGVLSLQERRRTRLFLRRTRAASRRAWCSCPATATRPASVRRSRRC
jgi:glutamate dehydrogenase